VPALPADFRLRRLAPLAIERVGRILPSRRSLIVGAGVVAVAACGYAIARETPLFAIHQVEVTGGSRRVDAQVTRALAPLVGKSLVGLDGTAVLQRTEALPTVVSATYDRAFPNTLRVTIAPERAVAVLRDGAGAWLISERGRVIRPVARTGARWLPRVWASVKDVQAGETLPAPLGNIVARALAATGSFRAHIAAVALTDAQLVFHLRSGLVLVFGRPTGIALKVAVATRLLRQLPSGTTTLDVSIPSRAVASP
jgi:cell division protein FtsQ